MINLKAQRLLDNVILDYMFTRGFHKSREAFIRDAFSNQNSDAIDSPQEAFLKRWWLKFYEAYSYKFPNYPILAAESFDKVALVVEDVLANNVHANQSYTFNNTEVNTSNVMPSTHLMESFPVIECKNPDHTELNTFHVIPSTHVMESSSLIECNNPDHTGVIPSTHGMVSSSLIECNNPDDTEVITSNMLPVMPSTHLMTPSSVIECNSPDHLDDTISYLMSKDTSILSPLKTNEINDMLPFESNAGYQMSSVPPEWNSRDDNYDIYLEGPTLMKSNIHATTNALDAGNDRSLQQASHQGLLSVDVFPNVGVQPLDKLKLSAHTSLCDFFHSLPQGDSSGKDAAGMLGDTNQRSLENSPPDQRIIAPTGGNMISYGKQPAMQIGRKRKTPFSYPEVQKEKVISTDIAMDNTRRGGAGISIKEIHNFHATNIKPLCCHFNSQGQFLATAGQNGKVLILGLRNKTVNIIGGHTYDITDIRFRPNSTVFATSSLDKTVKIWDAAKPSNTFRNLVGHNERVMSLDFHPTKEGLLSSCDYNDEIRLWDVNRRDNKLILKGGSRQVRFQPELGVLLATSTENTINIFDIQANSIQKKLYGHVKSVRSICWDMSGKFLASVSEDSARIWSISEGMCVFELFSSQNKFQSCTFHPAHFQTLAIGSDKVVECWNPFFQSNVTWPHRAHDGIISSLAVCHEKEIIASVSHDQWIKIWR